MSDEAIQVLRDKCAELVERDRGGAMTKENDDMDDRVGGECAKGVVSPIVERYVEATAILVSLPDDYPEAAEAAHLAHMDELWDAMTESERRCASQAIDRLTPSPSGRMPEETKR